MLDYVVRLAELGGVSGLLAEFDREVLAPRGLGAAEGGGAAPPPSAAAAAEVERRAAAAFAAEAWRDALVWYGRLCAAPPAGLDPCRALLAAGRCLLYLEDHAGALAAFERVAGLRPDDFDGQFYLGRARQLLHHHEAAVEALTRASLLRAGSHKCLLALAQSAHAGLTGSHGVVEPLAPEGRHRALAAAAYAAAIAASPKDRAARLGLARLRAEEGRVEEALEALAQGIAAGAPGRPLAEEACLIALRSGRLDLAPRLVEDLRARAPAHPLLGRMARVLRELRGPGQGEAPPGPPALALLAPGPHLAGLGALLGGAHVVARPGAAGGTAAALEAALRTRDEALVAVGADAAALRRAARDWRALAAPLARDADAAGVALGGGVPGRPGAGVLWRRAALLERLARADPASPAAAAHAAALAGARLAASPLRADPREPPPAPWAPGVVALVSRNGAHRFGGGEHFLCEAAAFYAAQGCRALLVGVGGVPEPAMADPGGGGGAPAAWTVPDDPRALRRLLEREGVGLVHAISGLGHLCAEAVGDTAIRLVYGVHHWREFLLSPVNHDYYYPYVDRKAKLHPGFAAILRRADAVYANSPYVASLCERHLGLLPVEIPSAVDDGFGRAPEDPADPDAARARGLGGGFALLVNARADKGFGLALDVAARLPDARFVAVAGQSSWDAACCMLAARDPPLRNVRLVRRFDDMAPLYRRARAVLVPSFRFVETFSRAVLEAQRLGVPVVGADAGNVPNLLAESGVALPEDPGAWAAEVGRLVADDAYHAERSAAASRASKALSSRAQAEGLARVYAGLRRRVLVLVGSGVGNVCHTTPLVRRLAEHLGAPVDVLVAADFPGCGALFRGAPWVASVYEAPEHALSRTYDLAVVTHSFGRVLPPLSCRRLLEAREVAPFDPARGEHEVDCNLRLLERGLGVAIREGDRRGYFLGTLRYRFPASRRVALHAGCKGGAYLVKRWPHFGALARALAARGHDVVSVGTPDEHVPGTGRAVGGTLEDTARELLGCDALVSNDSGVMNLANALGVPTVAFFGPSSARVRGPVAAPCLTFQAPLTCSPCEESPALRHRFAGGLCGCIGRIGLEDVLGPVEAFLERQHEAHAAAGAGDGAAPDPAAAPLPWAVGT